MTTDRAAGLAAARQKAADAGGRPAGKRRRRRPGKGSALAVTGAAVGGGLALVGVMAASARTAVVTADGSDVATESGEAVGTVTVRRVVLPVDQTGSSSSPAGEAAIVVPETATAPAVTTGSNPVTRTNGS